MTPPNCSGEQRQARMAAERSQLLTSQCKNKFPFPVCLFWQFHFILPGTQSANHPSGSPCSGNEDTSHLPLHFFPHYFLCAATIDVVPSEQPENALPSHRNLQAALTSPLIPTENHSVYFCSTEVPVSEIDTLDDKKGEQDNWLSLVFLPFPFIPSVW